MIVLDTRNVNHALCQGVSLVHQIGLREGSRNGDVLRVPVPVTTVYGCPTERVLFLPWRDANPFFHLVESMWMLAGRNTLADLTPYVARMRDYSDDGGLTQPAAYGHRWRFFADDRTNGDLPFNDQLDWVVQRLRANPADRRVVIQMWDPERDIEAADRNGKDVPCNLTALPWVSEGSLHLTVFCRSNDMVWGAYGANAVHFSLLLEYLACRLGLEVGTYTQISNNFHAYIETAGDPSAVWPVDWTTDPYSAGTVEPFGLFDDWGMFSENPGNDQAELRRDRILREDLAVFFEHGAAESATKARWPFLKRVVVPMALAHQHWKGGKGADRYEGALEILDRCEASDWRLAAKEWIMRRYNKWKAAQ